MTITRPQLHALNGLDSGSELRHNTTNDKTYLLGPVTAPVRRTTFDALRRRKLIERDPYGPAPGIELYHISLYGLRELAAARGDRGLI